MGKKQDEIYRQLTAAINRLSQPQNNPAQNFLTTNAIADAEAIKSKNFGNLSGMFGSIELPSQQQKNYQNLTNIGAEGIFALGDDGSRAAGQTKQLLADRFARDTSEAHQNNIRNYAHNVVGGLGQSAGAKAGNDAAVVSALSGLYQNMPKGNSWLGPLLNAGAQIGSSLITKF